MPALKSWFWGGRLGAQVVACLCALGLLAGPAMAQEAQIRKSLAERLPMLGKIDDVSKSAIDGLYEVRIGADIYYSDEAGNYLIEGAMIETRTRANLTEQKVGRMLAAELPGRYKDAIVWKQGTGARKLVVFADPNCGYCKRLERDLQKVKDVTVYTFMVAILGGGSVEMSRNIWCAKSATDSWRDWMLKNEAPEKVASCDTSAMDRNLALSQKYNIRGTPAVIFEDGHKVPGAISADQIERRLAEIKPKG
jgi:thiol:disulfide interchange protein DsbC